MADAMADAEADAMADAMAVAAVQETAAGVDALVTQAVAAARTGDRAKATSLLDHAIAEDEDRRKPGPSAAACISSTAATPRRPPTCARDRDRRGRVRARPPRRRAPARRPRPRGARRVEPPRQADSEGGRDHRPHAHERRGRPARGRPRGRGDGDSASRARGAPPARGDGRLRSRHDPHRVGRRRHLDARRGPRRAPRPRPSARPRRHHGHRPRVAAVPAALLERRGTGLSLGLSLRWQENRKETALQLQVPRALGLPASVRLTGFRGEQAYLLDGGLGMRRRGLDASLRHVVDGRTLVSLGVRARDRSFSRPDPNAPPGWLVGVEGGVETRLVESRRHRATAALRLVGALPALGSDLRFGQVDGEMRYEGVVSRPEGRSVERSVLALRVRAGWGSDGLPVDEMYAPGISPEADLPLRAHPLTHEGAIGANAMGRAVVLGNLEWRQRLVHRAAFDIGATAFADAARVSRAITEGRDSFVRRRGRPASCTPRGSNDPCRLRVGPSRRPPGPVRGPRPSVLTDSSCSDQSSRSNCRLDPTGRFLLPSSIIKDLEGALPAGFKGLKGFTEKELSALETCLLESFFGSRRHGQAVAGRSTGAQTQTRGGS